MSGSMIASGNGSGSNGEECSCSCYCGIAAFPAGASMGTFDGGGGKSPISSTVKDAAELDRRSFAWHYDELGRRSVN